MFSYLVSEHYPDYLVKPIDMDMPFQPSPQLTSYMDKIRKFEKEMLEKCQHAISTIFS
jgi:hypothetical protein